MSDLNKKTHMTMLAVCGVLAFAGAACADQEAAQQASQSKSFEDLIRRAIDELLDPWVLFGFAAQFMFMMRFVIQWIASERAQRSHVPVAFWYFSLAGGIMLLSYAIKRADPVFMLGQGLGCFIYIRNLILIYRRRAKAARHRKARRARDKSLVDQLLEDDGLENRNGNGDDAHGDVPPGRGGALESRGQNGEDAEPDRQPSSQT